MLHALTLVTLLAGAPGEPTATVVSDGSGTMTVVARGLRSSNGHVLFVMFDDKKGFPGKDQYAVRKGRGSIKGSVSKHVWKDVPAGTYAIAVVHDENDNGDVDTNFIGMPKEGIGVSNNPKGLLGPPKWKDAKFEHDGQSALFIKMRYLL